MIEIVILGGGFAGVRAGLIFKNKIPTSDNIHVTLIDKNSFHLFTPSLYEVATAEEPERNVVIPLSAIFNNSVDLVAGMVEGIDAGKQKVSLTPSTSSGQAKEYKYDYLIFALGSESADFGIPGIKEFGIPLKTLDDATKIKTKLATAKRIIVGGGGFSGTELACEFMAHHKQKEISLIQGSAVLLKELEDGVSSLAKKRLEEGGVRLILGEHIKKVTKDSVATESGKVLPYDLFVWTGGVKSDKLLGEIKTNECLQVLGLKNVFAAGDVVNPGVARAAMKMGEIAAENVLKNIKGEALMEYHYKNSAYVVPLGSHFAAFQMGKFNVSGFPAYFLQQFIFLRYLFQILSPIEALKRFRKFEIDLLK